MPGQVPAPGELLRNETEAGMSSANATCRRGAAGDSELCCLSQRAAPSGVFTVDAFVCNFLPRKEALHPFDRHDGPVLPCAAGRPSGWSGRCRTSRALLPGASAVGAVGASDGIPGNRHGPNCEVKPEHNLYRHSGTGATHTMAARMARPSRADRGPGDRELSPPVAGTQQIADSARRDTVAGRRGYDTV